MNRKEILKLRKELHQNPEISGKEFETKRRISEFLQTYAPKGKIVELGDTGLAVLFGENKDRTVMIRGDMDALPIQEINDLKYSSKIDGISHKCGHDGHSAILANLAIELNNNEPTNGRAVLLFQPAEENGEGAKSVLASPNFKAIYPDVCYALHNIPGYSLGKIIHKKGAFTPAVISLVLKINGKTAHAAEPENGVNPAYFMSRVLLESNDLVDNEMNSENFAVITPTHGMFGDDFAYGTAAGYGELRLTIRAWTNAKLDETKRELLEIAKKVAKDEGLSFDTEWTQEFRANMNKSYCVDHVVSTAKENNLELEERAKPFKWGEDFGLFTEHIDGCMFGIGAGENSKGLHNPDYDFPDEIIPTATKVFLGIINKELN